MFTGTDYDKFRALRVTHVATHFEQLLVDDALDTRRANRVDKLIRAARFGDPARLPPPPPCGNW